MSTNSLVDKTATYLDERVAAGKVVKGFARKTFPDHWSFMLGEICLYTFVILVISGTFLTLWYVPSMTLVTYEGPYAPLVGSTISDAYNSTLAISFEIRGGLLMRQIHHWSALLFVAAILAHMARVFVTGAFRKPREFNWVLGATLAVLGLAAGFTGYSLPDDLLSGNGLRIIQGVILSIPVVGTYIQFFLFGGQFPGESIIPRLFISHVMIVPALLIAVIGAHLALVIVHKHTQYPGPGRKNTNVIGYPLYPVYVAKAGGFFFIVFGVVTLISAFVTINPIWNYGAYDPSPISAGTQPDWYIGFVDGALRLTPGAGLEWSLFGYTLAMNVFLPALVIPGLMVTFLFAYPFLEAWVTGDKREHHLLDRPRNAPARTSIGVAALTFYVVLHFAAGADVIATHFELSFNDIIWALRILVIIGPAIAFFVTKRTCLALQRRDRDLALHGVESGRVVRTEDGEYFEVHNELNPYERWTLVQHEVYTPVELAEGSKKSLGQRARAWATRFYFEDRIEPVTPAELEEQHAVHGDGDTPAVGASSGSRAGVGSGQA